MFSCELWNFIAQPYSTLHLFVNKHTSYIKNKSLRQFEMYSFLKISLPLIVSCSYVLSIFVSLLTFYCNLTLQYVIDSLQIFHAIILMIFLLVSLYVNYIWSWTLFLSIAYLITFLCSVSGYVAYSLFLNPNNPCCCAKRMHAFLTDLYWSKTNDKNLQK